MQLLCPWVKASDPAVTLYLSQGGSNTATYNGASDGGTGVFIEYPASAVYVPDPWARRGRALSVFDVETSRYEAAARERVLQAKAAANNATKAATNVLSKEARTLQPPKG